jgi:hypothetical protein
VHGASSFLEALPSELSRPLATKTLYNRLLYSVAYMGCLVTALSPNTASVLYPVGACSQNNLPVDQHLCLHSVFQCIKTYLQKNEVHGCNDVGRASFPID